METLDLLSRAPGKFTRLVRTVGFAKNHRESIEKLLTNLPDDWNLGDRILCHFYPEYQEHIEQYYEHEETMLIDLLSSDVIKQLDQRCLESLKENISYQGKSVSKKELISNFYMVKEKLGRVPNLTELGEQGIFGQRTYHKKFGGYIKLLEELGETAPPKKKRSPVKKPRPYQCLQYLKEEYLSTKKRVGRVPMVTDLNVWDADQFNTAVTNFGGWKLFVDEMEKHDRS